MDDGVLAESVRKQGGAVTAESNKSRARVPADARKARNGARALIVSRQNQNSPWAEEARKRGDHVVVLSPPWWFRLWWRIRRFFGLVNDRKAQAELDARFKRLSADVTKGEDPEDD